MIPALATIVVIYIIYRCFTITLIEGEKLAGDKGSQWIFFILILLASVITFYLVVTELQGIRSVAAEMPEF